MQLLNLDGPLTDTAIKAATRYCEFAQLKFQNTLRYRFYLLFYFIVINFSAVEKAWV